MVARLVRAGERAVENLVSRYQLHAEPFLPVAIRQVARDEGWDVRYVEGLWPLYGFAVVKQNIRLMRINADVSPSYQRFAMAHEMGHVLNGDQPGLHLCGGLAATFLRWIGSRQERQASLAAARLLVPGRLLRSPLDVATVARLCEVPEELVVLARVGKE